MKATNYVEGILLFAAIVLYLVPIQSLTSMQDIPISILVALGSYGLLLIARKPRKDIKTSSLASKTAWHLAITGVCLGSFISYIASNSQAGYIGSTAIYMLCIFYGVALRVLVFSYINREPVKRKSENNHLPKHRFNTLEMSI